MHELSYRNVGLGPSKITPISLDPFRAVPPVGADWHDTVSDDEEPFLKCETSVRPVGDDYVSESGSHR